MSNELLARLHTENGPHELLEFFILLAAFFVCVHFLVFFKHKTRLLSLVFGLGAVACLYVAGEEISWGQHAFDWATPEFWRGVNDQGETNLHNTSSWLDQKPRAILEIGIVVSVVIWPLLQRFKPVDLPDWLANLWPSSVLGVIGLLVIVPKVLEKIFEAFDVRLFTRFSEVQEIYMYLFVLFYLVMLYRKERRAASI